MLKEKDATALNEFVTNSGQEMLHVFCKESVEPKILDLYRLIAGFRFRSGFISLDPKVLPEILPDHFPAWNLQILKPKRNSTFPLDNWRYFAKPRVSGYFWKDTQNAFSPKANPRAKRSGKSLAGSRGRTPGKILRFQNSPRDENTIEKEHRRKKNLSFSQASSTSRAR